MDKTSTPHSESTSPTFVFNPSQQTSSTPSQQSVHTTTKSNVTTHGRESTTPTTVFKK